MLKTLAGKHRSTVSKMAAQVQGQRSIPRTGRAPASKRPSNATAAGSHWSHGSAGYRCDGRRRRSSTTASRPGRAIRRKELITRLLADRCEICERTGNVQVHHIRKLADLDKSGHADRPAWAAIMAKRRRKTLVVCAALPRPPSTPGSQPRHSRSSHWRAGCPETGTSGSVGGRAEKDLHQLAPRRAAYPTLDCLKPSLQKVQDHTYRKDA